MDDSANDPAGNGLSKVGRFASLRVSESSAFVEALLHKPVTLREIVLIVR
jgi:hypothetical protein